MSLLLWMVVLLLVWLGVVSCTQRSVLFPRWAIPDEALLAKPAHAELIELQTPQGAVEAWFLPGDGIDGEHPGPAVIFAHGNGEVINVWPDELRRYHAMGVSVMLPEFRGYGNSAGSPSQEAIVDDFVQFRDLLAARPDVDAERIVYHGRSVGCGVVAQLAIQRPPTAMILQSSFTSAADVARRYLVPRFLMRDPLDVLAVVEALDRPILILHGEVDSVIPARHAQRLHDAALQSELIIYPGVGHNDPMPTGQYWQDIETFLLNARVLQP